MRLVNIVVVALLSSPLHRLLSGSVAVVRYEGRRSAASFSVPIRYARRNDEIIVFVGRPDTKSWWRNFRNGHQAELLVQRRWDPVSGRAIEGLAEPDIVAGLLDAYVDRFPRAAGAAGEALTDIDGAVVVRFVPQ